MNRQSGYTLIEVLVMLAITAILAAVVLETIQASASNGLRIEQAARTASQTHLSRAALRRAIEGSRAAYSDSEHRFIGNQERFSALTAQPLVTGGFAATGYSVRLETEDDVLRLVYEDASGSFTAAEWAEAEGSFSYFGAAERATLFNRDRLGLPEPRIWHEAWPVEQAFSAEQTYYQPLPLGVRLQVSSSLMSETLVFNLPANAGPAPRVQDLIGGLR